MGWEQPFPVVNGLAKGGFLSPPDEYRPDSVQELFPKHRGSAPIPIADSSSPWNSAYLFYNYLYLPANN
jgi:hypothetical protein